MTVAECGSSRRLSGRDRTSGNLTFERRWFSPFERAAHSRNSRRIPPRPSYGQSAKPLTGRRSVHHGCVRAWHASLVNSLRQILLARSQVRLHNRTPTWRRLRSKRSRRRQRRSTTLLGTQRRSPPASCTFSKNLTRLRWRSALMWSAAPRSCTSATGRERNPFFTMELQKTRIWVYLSLPPGEAQPWSDDEMRDASEIGHFGMGDTEFDLKSREQLTQLEAVVKQAYTRNRQ
jgi:predicted transport protein